jgi:hypothetical protein
MKVSSLCTCSQHTGVGICTAAARGTRGPSGYLRMTTGASLATGGVFIGLTLLSLLFLAGCSSRATDPGVPRDASLVVEITGAAGSRVDRYTPLQSDVSGALYVVDATRQQLVYSGEVEAGQQIRLYYGGVTVVSVLPGRSRTPYERSVTRFHPGVTYRVYYHPGATPVNPTTNEGSPLTRPYVERAREVRPSGEPEQR